jgi:indole-3-glycerol phosphate synthase
MTDYLEKIAAYKKEEVDKLIQEVGDNPEHPLNKLLSQGCDLNLRFSTALKQPHLTVIGEVKRRSPSRGEFEKIEDPLKLALQYAAGGAAAISVLTDNRSFGGSLDDLREVSKGIPTTPTLRKEFVIHPLQMAEAVVAGASAVLLIVRLVKGDLKRLLAEAARLGLEVLTEINNREELDLAVEAGASIIGVNHRNLRTFETDLTISDELCPLIPSSAIKVAASGMHTPEDARRMRALGYDAVLVGEALVRTKNPSLLIRQMQGACHEG